MHEIREWNIGGMIFTGENPKFSERNPSQGQFVYHKSHTDLPRPPESRLGVYEVGIQFVLSHWYEYQSDDGDFAGLSRKFFSMRRVSVESSLFVMY